MSPLIEAIGSIKISIYSREHRPPHVHVLYNEFEALLEIETFDTYAGYLPSKQMKQALGWLKENQQDALALFKQLNPEL